MAVYNPYQQNQVGYSRMDYAPQPVAPVMQQAPPQGVRWVDGEDAARTYPIPYNSTALLMDRESPVLYVKTVDHMGRITEFEIYDLINRAPKKETQGDFVTKDDLDKLMSEMNKRFDEISYKRKENRKEDR